jgi:hypothetical protein
VRPVLLLAALIWVPFLSIFAFANPALTERVGDSHPHVVFHLLAAGLLVWAFVVARRFRSAATGRSVRVLSGLLLLTLPLAVLGNLAELATAVDRLAADGWESRLTPELFEEGAHAVAASVTIPAHLASMLLVLALVAVVALTGGRRLEPVR